MTDSLVQRGLSGIGFPLCSFSVPEAAWRGSDVSCVFRACFRVVFRWLGAESAFAQYQSNLLRHLAPLLPTQNTHLHSQLVIIWFPAWDFGSIAGTDCDLSCIFTDLLLVGRLVANCHVLDTT